MGVGEGNGVGEAVAVSVGSGVLVGETAVSVGVGLVGVADGCGVLEATWVAAICSGAAVQAARPVINSRLTVNKVKSVRERKSFICFLRGNETTV